METDATWLTKGGIFNSWEEICCREELGRRSCGWKKLNVFISCLFNTYKATQRSWFTWEYLQYTRTSCFNCSDWRYKRVCLVHNRLLLLRSKWCEIFAIIFCGICWWELDSVCVCKGGNMKKKNHWALNIFRSKKTLPLRCDAEKSVSVMLTVWMYATESVATVTWMWPQSSVTASASLAATDSLAYR